MSFATVGSVTLHYAFEGVGQGRPLVFVNSLGTDLRMWDGLIPHFAVAFPIMRYDKRGHGLSDCRPGIGSIEDQVDDLAGLLDYLQVDDLILIGISIGGMIAQAFAARYARKVRALVLCDTAPKIGTVAYWDQRIAAIREQGLDGMAEVILERWFAPAFPVQHPAEYRGYFNMLTRTPVEGYLAACEALRDADLSEELGAITAKTLVLFGAKDLATPPELGRALAETLADARFEQIEASGHLPPVEQPEAVADVMIRFFRENSYV